MEIIKIRDHAELAHKAALWFHTKWGVPLETGIQKHNRSTGKRC